MELPAWLRADDRMEKALPGRRSFVDKNLTRLSRLLTDLRRGSDERTFISSIRPNVRLIIVLALIVLITCSQSAAFILLMAVALLVLLSMTPMTVLRRVLAVGLMAGLLMTGTLLPAWLLGFGGSIGLMAAKIWLTVSLSGLLALTTTRHELTGALKAVHLPDLPIFILDLALAYIAVLGNLALQLFQALKVRSVGREPHRVYPLAGIAGTLFLKSKDLSEEVADAMACRGFTGRYRQRREQAAKPADLIGLTVVLLAVLAFFTLK